jgi:rhamnogalacturonyl hydrolase YesR
MDPSYTMTRNWLLESGIFVSDSSDQNYGGVHSFFDEEKNEFAFLYPEITGYFISTMRFLYEHEKNEKFVKLAKASSNWLIRLYEEYGGIIQGISTYGVPQKYAYSFDTGICSKGLLDCFAITKEEKFLEYAKKLNQWILNETIESNGFVKPTKNLQTNEFEEDTKVWYKRSGCLHIKLAIPLLQQYQITKDESLLNMAKKIADSILSYQNNDGSILLHADNKIINVHTMCYALEGLIHTYMITKNENYISKCKQAITWCDQKIQNDGSIDLWSNSKYHSKSSYPIAQLIRLKIFLAKLDGSSLDETIKKLESFLLSLQAHDGDKKINGGFYEEFHKSVFGWKKTLKVNSWASMFSLQALYWLENFSTIDLNEEYELLY